MKCMSTSRACHRSTRAAVTRPAPSKYARVSRTTRSSSATSASFEDGVDIGRSLRSSRLRPDRTNPLEADGGASLRQELDELHAADDGGTRHQVVLVELALLEAWRAHVDRPAGLREVVHQLAERREPLLADVVGIALLCEADAFGAQEHEGLLARAECGIREHEGHRRLVLIVLRVREIDAESVRHDSGLLSSDLVDRMVVFDQRVPGQAAPRRNVGTGAAAAGGQDPHLAGAHRLQALTKLEHELATAEIARVPLRHRPAQARLSTGKTFSAKRRMFFCASAWGREPNWKSPTSTPTPSSRAWPWISRTTWSGSPMIVRPSRWHRSKSSS